MKELSSKCHTSLGKDMRSKREFGIGILVRNDKNRRVAV